MAAEVVVERLPSFLGAATGPVGAGERSRSEIKFVDHFFYRMAGEYVRAIDAHGALIFRWLEGASMLRQHFVDDVVSLT